MTPERRNGAHFITHAPYFELVIRKCQGEVTEQLKMKPAGMEGFFVRKVSQLLNSERKVL